MISQIHPTSLATLKLLVLYLCQQAACLRDKAGQRGIAADNREFDKDHQRRSNNEPNPLRQAANQVVHCPDRERDDCPKWKHYEKELEVQTVSILHACLEQTISS